MMKTQLLQPGLAIVPGISLVAKRPVLGFVANKNCDDPHVSNKANVEPNDGLIH